MSGRNTDGMLGHAIKPSASPRRIGGSLSMSPFKEQSRGKKESITGEMVEMDLNGSRSFEEQRLVSSSDVSPRFRRISVLGRVPKASSVDVLDHHASQGEALSTSPTLSSSLFARFSFRASRDSMVAASPPSPSTAFATLDVETPPPPPAEGESLELALKTEPGFAQELINIFLAGHIADATRKLRFVMAVLEFQRTEDKKERKFKGKKIVDIFLLKSSVFNILQDVPAEALDSFHYHSSPQRIENILMTIKRIMLEQISELQEVKTRLSDLSHDDFGSEEEHVKLVAGGDDDYEAPEGIFDLQEE